MEFRKISYIIVLLLNQLKSFIMQTEKIWIDWNFIEKYLPNYSHRDDVLVSDRLQCFIDNEIEDKKEEAELLERYGSIENAKKVLEAWDTDLMIEAVNNYTENHFAKKTYFLFGSVVTKSYFDSGIDEVIEDIKNHADYALFVYTEGENIFELLNAADGYGGYSAITESEYNRLMEL